MKNPDFKRSLNNVFHQIHIWFLGWACRNTQLGCLVKARMSSIFFICTEKVMLNCQDNSSLNLMIFFLRLCPTVSIKLFSLSIFFELVPSAGIKSFGRSILLTDCKLFKHFLLAILQLVQFLMRFQIS